MQQFDKKALGFVSGGGGGGGLGGGRNKKYLI